jgi:two-component system CheB/CheR fusion protein
MSSPDQAHQSEHQSEAAPERTPSSPFPVVGIGASAGGLEAFTELLGNLPREPGMAFLFVQHLEPHHKSQLPEILSRATPMPVQEATEGLEVKPDHLYLIPPKTNIALVGNRLTLSPRAAGRGINMPADHLFRSLASTQKERAIGVILSGGGTDGTLGFQAIKAEGGITFAQSEGSAKQTGMPRSAITDGNVDYVLSPTEIAQQLVRLNGHPYTQEKMAREPGGESDSIIADIISQLRKDTAVDFSHYKQPTIRRRLQRRMALRGMEDLADYRRLLLDDPAELQALYQDFLIRVTQFFRDPEAFQALTEKAFPRLVVNRSADSPIRIWVAGCATGEEVYSLAICLLEFLAANSLNFPIKFLGTDLSDVALNKARSGLYVDNIEIDVSPERLRNFFVRVDGHYQISKAVRDLCVFSRHNMSADPPFSHLDLVSCRNVLIYMDLALQKRVLPVLHYALNPNGILFLGTSENVGGFTDHFEALDAKYRIFTKRPMATAIPLDFTTSTTPEGVGFRGTRDDTGTMWSALDVQREADRIVLARYAPVGVVVDEAGIVLQFRGRTSAYLEPAPGLATLDLMRMVREGLLAEVRAALNHAKVQNAPMVKDGIRIAQDGQSRLVKIEVIPFKIARSAARFFLVLLQDTPVPQESPPSVAEVVSAATSNDQQLAQLQQELSAMREYLQSVIEEQENTNEELKSANEEILSANEELQSTNEELQTAKEEAQSANEELATVNDELRHRNTDLSHVNNDLLNVLTGVNIPIVMVGRELRIRRFTPHAERLLNLIPTDLGRPISDIKPNIDVPDLSKSLSDKEPSAA